MPYPALPGRACLAEPRHAVPSPAKPCPAKPSRALPRPADPGLACLAMPGRAVPSLAQPCLELSSVLCVHEHILYLLNGFMMFSDSRFMARQNIY